MVALRGPRGSQVLRMKRIATGFRFGVRARKSATRAAMGPLFLETNLRIDHAEPQVTNLVRGTPR